MLLHGTLVGGDPVAVPEHGAPVVPNPVQVKALEFPVEKITFPNSSLAGPAPDIQIVSKPKLLVAVSGCLSLSWFAGSSVRVPPFQIHPKIQPRELWPVGLAVVA
jgi:hypothetical protein